MNFSVTFGVERSEHECIHVALATARAYGPGALVHRIQDGVLISRTGGVASSPEARAKALKDARVAKGLS